MKRKQALPPPLGRPISFRLSEEELSVFRERLRQSGLSATEFLRLSVISDGDRQRKELQARKDYARILYVLNRIDRSLEDLARKSVGASVQGDTVPEPVLAVLERLCRLNSGLLEDLRHADPD